MPLRALRAFLRLESAGGLLLIGAAAFALLVANSPLAVYYTDLLATRVAVIFGALQIDKPLLLWINDGLMAVFFLLVGLELKREVLAGELSNREQLALPVAGALGGFVVPAAIYVWLNWNDAAALNGWAIPSATDIAFALGVLSLFADRVPLALKVFLASLAIIDDLAAIVVIAVFYSADLSLPLLLSAAGGAAVLFALNRLGVVRIAAYVLVGVVIWVLVLKSGVHATLAGVIIALAIPLRTADPADRPLQQLEHELHPWVAFLILPLFAFANAGVTLVGVDPAAVINGVSIGIVAGLFVGKQCGVFLTVWVSVRLRLAVLPSGVRWRQLHAVAVLTGIGFTMSLFIGTLAFEHGNFDYTEATRAGVLAGSLLSAVCGYALLRPSLRKNGVRGDSAPTQG